MSDVYDDGPYRKDLPPNKRTNPLLVRNVVGKVKPTTYTLPSSTFTYGRRDQFDQEGVREVVGSWREHTPAPESIPGRDFMKLNKASVHHGAVNSKEMSTFRQTHDARLRSGPISYLGRTAPADPNFTYGKPSKPSTPIHDVVTNTYQRQAIVEARTSREKKAVRTIQNNYGKYAQSQHTRASLGHTKVPAPAVAPPFKMSRFTDVPPRTETYRHTKRLSYEPQTTETNTNIYTHDMEPSSNIESSQSIQQVLAQ